MYFKTTRIPTKQKSLHSRQKLWFLNSLLNVTNPTSFRDLLNKYSPTNSNMRTCCPIVSPIVCALRVQTCVIVLYLAGKMW